MKFQKEDLKEIAYGGRPNGFKIISNDIVDHSRWSIHHYVIFSFGERFFSTYYSVAATESQDERPYQDDPDEIECDEMKPVEKTITVYEKV